VNGWTVQLARPVAKELEKLPSKAVQRISNAIHGLADNPHPRGCKKLVGEENTYRIRVGEYRVIYEIHEREVLVLVVRVRHRKDVYK
jgi:mRNA interferase RelE/StbE